MSDFITVVGWADNAGNELHVNTQEHKLGNRMGRAGANAIKFFSCALTVMRNLMVTR